MAETESFAELIHRVRSGDTEATARLWHQYEPFLRRDLRLRLRDPRLRRVIDETDVCQSVMASFFVRMTAGQFELDGPAQLQHLLTQMGRNKLATQMRHHMAQRRDIRRVESIPEGANLGTGADPTPSKMVEWGELLKMFRDRLSDEERQIADLRAAGKSWPAVAEQLGGTADGRRQQLNRAVARVSGDLGLDPTEEYA